ncbi:MAG TPA: hypothetical protein VL988_08840 [Solirubrobacteraceae bacterium]|nr:hypothetical protein [Solirubrobacteraceae bacterium]
MRLTATLLAAAACLTACAKQNGTAGAHPAVAPNGGGATASATTTQVPLSVPRANAAPPLNVPHALTIPSGWHAEAWARVGDARFMAWTPQHRLLVSAPSYGSVVALTPGRGMSAPRAKVLIGGLTEPQGLAFDTLKGKRVLYVAESNQIDRYLWRANGTVGSRRVLVRGLPDTDPSGDDVHRLKSIAVGHDHTIYVTAGSASNASPDPPGEKLPRASILAFRADGSHGRVFASGVRNGEGLAFAPDGTLWTAVNQRDEVPYPFHGPYEGHAEAFGQTIDNYVGEHPPDEVARLTAGRNLGWPYCNPDPDVTPGSATTAFQLANMPFTPDARTNPGEAPLKCGTLPRIERGLPAHSAPLGFHFLRGSAMGAPWSGGAVVATHGSWDRTPPRAPAVLWMPWERKARTLGGAIVLIGGFQEASGRRWGRPADVVAGPDGSLYVSDDTAGAVYRIGPRVAG